MKRPLPFAAPPYEPATLSTSLSLEECRRRLTAKLDGPFAVWGARPIVGRLSQDRLRARKRIKYRNSFQTLMRADLAEREGRTFVLCRFGLDPFVVVFLCVWFGGVLLACGLTLTAGVAGLPATPIPVLMLIFGAALLRFGRYLARDERAYLLDFLRGTLDARDAPAPPR